jgi:MSHA biogenesis protein MshM
MIQEHFGLKYIPLAKNSASLWMSPELIQLQKYFTQLLHAPGIGVLTGEPGVGKTTALRNFTQTLNPHQYQVFYLSETLFTSFDIYRQIATHLGLVPAHRFAMLWRDIKMQIKERVEHKRSLPIFIIDEAQNLPLDFFRGFPSFMNFDFDSRDMMIIWFVGHPILNTILDRGVYSALASRIQIRYSLSPIFERENFWLFIQKAFADAGCNTQLLSESGMELLRTASEGKPRSVHRILVGSLQLAMQKNLSHLPDDLIQEVVNSLRG